MRSSHRAHEQRYSAYTCALLYLSVTRREQCAAHLAKNARRLNSSRRRCAACHSALAAFSGMLTLVRSFASRLSCHQGRTGLELSAAAACSVVSGHAPPTASLHPAAPSSHVTAAWRPWRAAMRRMSGAAPAAAAAAAAAAEGPFPTPPQQEYYVYACAFMLSSSLDLGKLKPQLSDVLHDSGKDYLVLSFRPSPNRYQRAQPPRRFLPRTDGPQLAAGANVPGLFCRSPRDAILAEQRGGANSMSHRHVKCCNIGQLQTYQCCIGDRAARVRSCKCGDYDYDLPGDGRRMCRYTAFVQRGSTCRHANSALQATRRSALTTRTLSSFRTARSCSSKASGHASFPQTLRRPQLSSRCACSPTR